MLRDGEHIPLSGLRYGGSAHSFGFAIYSAAHDSYQDVILRLGLPAGTPQEALDYRLHDPPHRVAQPRTRVICIPMTVIVID